MSDPVELLIKREKIKDSKLEGLLYEAYALGILTGKNEVVTRLERALNKA